MATAQATAPPAKRRPDVNTVFTINEDGSRNFIQLADVHGPWQRRRNVIYAALLAIYLGMPWVQVGGKPLFHIDLPNRAAHLFGATFTNQDFHLVFFLVSGLGFALFVTTSLWGRLWCGFVCPQTIFMEGIVRRIERWVEGPKMRRLRRAERPWSFDNVWRKVVKHALLWSVATLLVHTFLVYFIPVRELLSSTPFDHKVPFYWTLGWAGLLYFDFAWFREQTCIVICPYGRLQSALIDPDTVIIGYDEKRGEPRHKGVAEGGDCVDCFRCVEVCPTGIDIRNGLQMECIGCANCIDACDTVMEKVGKPKGLVRYDSQRGFETGRRRRFLRPRAFVYAALAIIGITVFSYRVMGRTSFQANLLRTPGLPFSFVEDRIRNLYNLHVQNKTDRAATYTIAAAESTTADYPRLEFIIPQESVVLESFEDGEFPIFAELPRSAYGGPFTFHLVVTDSGTGEAERIEIRFRGP
jgi:cytochrome c oxidase accessory protein FixG